MVGGLVQPLPKRLPGVGGVHPWKPWWGCLCDVCFASKKPFEQEFFVPAGMHLGVKLLIGLLYYHSMTHGFVDQSEKIPDELILY